MRFMIWQQCFVIITFVLFLFLYLLAIYRVTNGLRTLRSTLLRLFGVVVIGSVLWVAVAWVVSIITQNGLQYAGVRKWLVDRAFNSTFAFPFRDPYIESLYSNFPDYPVVSFIIIGTIPITLLLLGGLVVVADRVLARGPMSIQEHRREFGSALVGVALLAIAMPLWPQPLSNPEMQRVPIPQEAVEVEYGFVSDSSMSPRTNFTVEGWSSYDLLKYYKDALEADGWRPEQDGAYSVYPIADSVVYSKNSRLLQIYFPSRYSNTHASLIMWRSSQAMFNHIP